MTSPLTGPPASTAPKHAAHLLLARAHSPTTAAQLFTAKIQQKPLLLQKGSPPAVSEKRALRRHIRLRKKEYFLRKQKPRPLSAKERRIFGVHELRKEECKYVIYEGLHRMWVGYMQEVLGLTPYSDRSNIITANVHGSLLASADYHGAEVQVVRSSCVDRVGLKGIVVRDTKFTLVIVTSTNEVKTIPKKDTIFRFEVPFPHSAVEKIDVTDKDANSSRHSTFIFELHGNQFELRPADRASRKFKWKATDRV